MAAGGHTVALTASAWATWLGIPTAIIVAAIGPMIQRRAQERRDATERDRQKQLDEGSYVGTLIKGYEGRISDLRTQMAADKRECIEEIIGLRREHEKDKIEVRQDCAVRVAQATERHEQQLRELEQRIATQDREHQRDRERWERERSDLWRQLFRAGNGRGRGTDDTPPPEGRR